jgi:hypothetical protein
MNATPDQDRPQDEQTAAPDVQGAATEADGQTPSNEELEEPSTEKPPGKEPKAPDPDQPEPSHEAVGIGVIGRPLVDPEPPAEDPEA